MKVTHIILAKLFLITPPETWVWEKKENCQIQNLNLPGEWLIGIGWVMTSVVNITTDVVLIPSNWLIADDMPHC